MGEREGGGGRGGVTTLSVLNKALRGAASKSSPLLSFNSPAARVGIDRRGTEREGET